MREPEQVVGAYIVVTVPLRMTPDEIEHELKTCISFGSPEVTVISNVPAETNVSTVVIDEEVL